MHCFEMLKAPLERSPTGKKCSLNWERVLALCQAVERESHQYKYLGVRPPQLSAVALREHRRNLASAESSQ